MTDEITQGGYENDLRSAENAIEAAGEDPVARATAFRRHSEAQRNMMQAVIVPMFVQMVERSLQDELKPLIEGQKETHSGIAALSGQFHTLARTVARLETAMRAQDKRHKAQIQALVTDIAAIKAIIAARPAERIADNERLEARLSAMEVRLASLEARG